MALNWHKYTLRRAIVALFSNKDTRLHVEGDGLHVHIEDILPPILIVLGRLVMDVQHFFKMHKTSEYEIEGWPDTLKKRARIVAGCLNMWVLHCIGSYLSDSFIKKQHSHALLHMIGQFCCFSSWDKTAEFFEQHFQNYKIMGKCNPDTILRDMAYCLDNLMEKRKRLAGGQSAAKHASLGKFLAKLRRPWHAVMLPVKFTLLQNGLPWKEFKQVCKPLMDAAQLFWKEDAEQGVIYLQCTAEAPEIMAHIQAVVDGVPSCHKSDTENPSFMHKLLSEFADCAMESRESAQAMLHDHQAAATEQCAGYSLIRGKRCTPDHACQLILTRLYREGLPLAIWVGKKVPKLSENNLKAAAFELQRQVPQLCTHMYMTEACISYQVLEESKQHDPKEFAELLKASTTLKADMKFCPSVAGLKMALHAWYQAWCKCKADAIESGTASSNYWKRDEHDSFSDLESDSDNDLSESE